MGDGKIIMKTTKHHLFNNLNPNSRTGCQNLTQKILLTVRTHQDKEELHIDREIYYTQKHIKHFSSQSAP